MPEVQADFWERAGARLSKRWAWRMGLFVLGCLYSLAVYAPLIANDRPYVLTAVDRGAYERALRFLPTVTGNLLELASELPETSEGRANWRLGVERECAAARARIETLVTYLGEEDRASLVDLSVALERAQTAARQSDPVAAGAAASDAGGFAAALGQVLAPDLVTLVPARSWPLFEALSLGQVFTIALWTAFLLLFLWSPLFDRFALGGDRDRIRSWRVGKALCVLGDAVLFTLLWWALVGGGSATFETAPFKNALTRGTLVAEHVVFPPFAMGYAETHASEIHRPPTWTTKSEMDEAGRYVHREDGVESPRAPVVVQFAEPERNSTWRHPAGTDASGRDVFVRLLWGARVSLSVGLLSAVLLTLIGVALGSLAGYCGGLVDTVVMRVVEVLQSIPALFLILLAMAFTDPAVVPPIVAIVVVIAAIRWTGTARLVRGEFLRLRERDFVLAAEGLGLSPLRVALAHILPNALGPILVSATFAVATGILTESAVSFLGLGIQEPGASWGALVNESRNVSHWWIHAFPGLLIFLTVTCYNLVGDALRDALDPKLE